jgi:phage terminase large subunit
VSTAASAFFDGAGSAKAAQLENSGFPAFFDWKNPDYEAVWRDRQAKLDAMREHPGRWPALLEVYAEDPIAFINHWGTTYDSRNAGTKLPTALPFLLFQRQAEFVDWVRRRWERREDGLVEKSRDMGISWCCIAFAVWLWRFHPGSVTGFSSYKEDYVDKSGDPKSLFWKARYLIDRLPVELKPIGYNAETDAPYMRISNKGANTTIFGESGDNIGRGARASIYFKDESAHYQQAESIDAALSQTSNCQIDVSTPNGEGNAFWRKRFGGHVKLFVFDWREDPRKDEAWYEAQKLRMTPVALAAEVDRDYSASITNSFIVANVVGEAQRRGPAEVKASGYLQAGLDVARFGDDSNVLSIRRGRVLLKQVTWKKSDLESTAGRARRELEAFKEMPAQIAIDTIGVGAGVADMMRNYPGYRDLVVDVNSSLRMTDGQNYNLRAAMWVAMRDWLGTASIPNSTELRSSLTALRYFYRGGELLLESKDDAKKRGIKSPDEADSLALTFAYPVKPPPKDPDQWRVSDPRPDAETGM